MDDSVPAASAYAFLDWRYQPDTRCLAGAAGERRLKPLLDRLLRRFLDAPGQVLAREALIDSVWTRREVNDEVLSRAVAELRGLLGDDARDPRCIETLSKGGYRWIAPVRRLGADPTDPGGNAPPINARGRRWVTPLLVLGVLAALVVAVLPRDPRDRGETTAASARLLAATPLTSDPRPEYDARFDATGNVVFIRGEMPDRGSALLMIDPVSRAERMLWRDDASLRHPAPAPDGRSVAVMRRADDSCELWRVSLVDLARQRLADCARAGIGGIEWVDDDHLISTGEAADDAHAPGLVLHDLRSGTQRVLTAPTAGEGAHGLARLSPDRTRLVHANRRNGETQLLETDWPGLGERRALLGRHEPVFGHAFEADGRALWIAGDLTTQRALHRFVAGTPPQLLGGRGAMSIDLGVGGRAVWAEARHDADILVRPSAGAEWRTIARSNRYETQPAFSPDGTRLALVSNRDGSERVLVADLRDGSARALPLDPRRRWVRPTWSTRDDALILTAYEDRHTRLYRLRADAATPEPVAVAGDNAFHGHELDDRLVWLGGHGGEHGTLLQLRHGQKTPETLALGDVLAYRANRDWLVWRTHAPARLRAARWDAPDAVRDIALAGNAAPESFALAGDRLAWVDGGRLWSLHLPDGAAREMAGVEPPDANGPNLALGPDGALALARLISVGIDLMHAAAE
ncbi:MAG: winged helix-turn-helix domain-containing protein [Piscinibacter sp.]|nr:winged helix-turn-helix domain-containing protein [Piscinibacter sp.]